VGFVSLAPYVDSERRGVGVVAFFLVLFLATLGGGVCVDVSCSWELAYTLGYLPSGEERQSC